MKKNYGLYLQLLWIHTTKKVAKKGNLSQNRSITILFSTQRHICVYILLLLWPKSKMIE